MSENKSLYNLNWATAVYQQFMKNHTRATEDVNEMFGTDEKYVINLLRQGANGWYRWKKAVKIWDNWLGSTNFPKNIGTNEYHRLTLDFMAMIHRIGTYDL